MGKIESNFSHSFEGKVWNLMMTEDGESLLFEIRDDTAFKTSYSMLSLERLSFEVDELNFEEEWWIGVTYATKDVILFHTYENPDNPDDRRYFTFDVNKRTVLWEGADLNLTHVENLIAEHVDPETHEHQYIDIMSGQQVIKKEVKPVVENKKVNYAFHYVEGSEYFNTVDKFLASVLSVRLVEAVDYYQFEKGVVISYYLREGNVLSNRLVVVSMERKVLFEETLGENLTGISDNTFFIYGDNLIFVKEKQHFFIYPLTYK